MSTLTILSDQDVRKLLHDLTREDVMHMQMALADALHYYSTSTEELENGCSATLQPHRTVVERKDGTTTLFMPASSNEGMGMKVVTTVPSSISTQDLNSPAPTTAPRGTLTLLDSSGSPTALLNATELTAFRTALASTLLLQKRANVHDVTIFGAGKQAYWHARLALLLRGSDIHHLNIVNRSFDRAAGLLRDLFKADPAVPLWQPKLSVLTPSHGEYAHLLKTTVRGSSVIFTTTPSTAPVFPAELLTASEGRKKGRYIAAVGSYKPEMIEVPPEVVQAAVSPPRQARHFHYHRHATPEPGGAVVVDTLAGCMREAGEIIQAGVTEEEVVEIGELIMLKHDAERRGREERGGGGGRGGSQAGDDGGLNEWLAKGNVVYKSVGLGLMDVVVGGELVKLANARGIGTKVENF
ncbi:NAD(P)-binding protein [Eremomyces bilateralis CBS 781.70]|uniref:NAD(P)-binding protein n=1 Tax=Eremomyces bilateralis CBS 781.70 TaxID=1392243 RepID=A0A6G1G236_9PEZI|nr:NAD(P)-binding protein [Eremomyces bilateralis CBS 781.70]KAF1812175.1 NAD(P)-binding protein [Eremomyces bilateralis CBS 781.70]